MSAAILTSPRTLLGSVRTAYPLIFFAAIYLIAAVITAAAGYYNIFAAAQFAALTVFMVITVMITQTAPANTATDAAERRRLWLQTAVIGVIIALTLIGGLNFHNVTNIEIPLWAQMDDVLGRWGFDLLGSSTYLTNPVHYVVIPLALLLLLGATPAELGFNRGHHVLPNLILWCGLPVLMFIYAVLAGVVTPGRLGDELVRNFFNNGFFEEFLFRGALLTRLRRLTTPGWALVISSLVFGVWHLGLGYNFTGYGDVGIALASTIAYQAFLGLTFGVIFERTRSLLVPSAFHICFNALGLVVSM